MSDRYERKEPSEATTAQVYVVQNGDSLERIASLFYGDRARWRDILDANARTLGGSTELLPGQRIVIPHL